MRMVVIVLAAWMAISLLVAPFIGRAIRLVGTSARSARRAAPEVYPTAPGTAADAPGDPASTSQRISA